MTYSEDHVPHGKDGEIPAPMAVAVILAGLLMMLGEALL